jgi:glyoxylase-like metal-dependent hydrolase (beta-lactamase superfamily II)
MASGDFEPVAGVADLYSHETGMYGVDGYGAVYVYDTPEPAMIDTGIGTNHETLFATLDALGIDEPAHVIPTHAHLDHAGGAGFLAARYPSATVRTHERAVRHLVDPGRLIEGTKRAVGDAWRHYVEPKPVPADRIVGLADGDRIDLGDRELVYHYAGGHAPHQGVLHDPTAGVLFTADAAGLYTPQTDEVHETTPPPQFDLEECLADVDRLLALEPEPETLCFAHFGPRAYDPDLLSGYRRTLVEWVAAVRERRAREPDDEAVIEHFAETTELDAIWGSEKAAAEARLNAKGALAYLDRVDGA